MMDSEPVNWWIGIPALIVVPTIFGLGIWKLFDLLDLTKYIIPFFKL